MTGAADVVVIGAGIVGAACAEALSAEGLRVIVVESGSVGGGTTAAGMGHLVVMDDSEAQFALCRYSRDLWNRLAPELPAQVEFNPCGTLWIAADEEDMEAVRRKCEYHRARGVRSEILDEIALAAAEPNLRRPLPGGVLAPDDGVINAPAAAGWLISRAQSRGAELRAGRAVEVRKDEVRLGDGARIPAGRIVCATGIWTDALAPEVAIRPRKGHLAITEPHPGFLRRQVVEMAYRKSAHEHAGESIAFNIEPRRGGEVLIGSSRQYGRNDAAVESEIVARMLSRAVEFVPALARLPVVRTWTGFRPATADNLPVIGPCPGREHVFLATGHEGLGITTAPGTARLIAGLIVGRDPEIDASPYAPARLAGAARHPANAEAALNP